MKKIKTFLDNSLFRTRFYAKKTLGEVEKIRSGLEKTHLEFAYHMQERLCWDRATQERCRSIFAKIRPVNLSLGKVRIGRDFDGGYVVPSDWANTQHLLSLGIGDDNSFETCFAEAGAQVHCYDHSVSSLPEPHPSIRLFQRKVVGNPGQGPLEKNFHEVLEEIPQGLSALKMDIEGFEYECFRGASVAQLEKIRFIVLEIHETAESLALGRHDRVAALFEKLTSGFHCFHVHANNLGGGRMLGGAFVPNLLELSFAHKAHYGLAVSQAYDFQLDQPNDPGRPDIWCGYW